MDRLTVYFIVLFLVKVEGTSRIVGGYKPPGSYGKFHASLQNLSGSHVCGGAIISRRHVLTAAHCVQGAAPEHIKVVIGTTNLDNGGIQYNVSSIEIHNDYNIAIRRHDIAIIKIKKQFNTICRAKIIEPYGKELETGDTLVLTGFGSQEPNGDTSRQMYALNLTVFDQETCRYAMRNVREVHDEMFCTFSTKGEGTCHGDSGGPLVKNNTLVGLVSWGIPCAVGFPDVHTRITPYLEWIQKLIKPTYTCEST